MKKKIITIIVVLIFLLLSIANVNASDLSNPVGKEQTLRDMDDTLSKNQGYENSKTFKDAKLGIFLDGRDPLSLFNMKGGGSANLKIIKKLSRVPILTPIIVGLMKFFDKRGVSIGDFPSIPSVFKNEFDMTIEFIKEGDISELLCYGTTISERNTSTGIWEEKLYLKNEKHKIELTHKKVNTDSPQDMLDNCVAICWWYEWLIDYEVPRSIIDMNCTDITIYYN